jgi:hypothetical protein
MHPWIHVSGGAAATVMQGPAAATPTAATAVEAAEELKESSLNAAALVRLIGSRLSAAPVEVV